jgi:UDP-2,3-diacylglucosamine hydrolase
MLQAAPLAFDASTFEIWGALLNGASLVVLPTSLPSMNELAEAIRRHDITTLWLTSMYFVEMVEANVMGLHGVRWLLSHGDALCTGDLAYQRFRRVVRGAAFQKSWHLLPLGMRRGLATLARRRSRAYTRRLPDSIADVTPAAVTELLRATGGEILVHGHTHRQDMHRVGMDGHTRTRIVLGDWHERGNALAVYTDGRYEFLNIEASEQA